MEPKFDMQDPKAWDDSFLQETYREAVKEYERYHSIHKSGMKLEDALTEEELKELREDHGAHLEETETPSGAAAETDGDADQADTEMIHAEADGVGTVQLEEQEPVSFQQQQDPASQEKAAASTIPEALLGTVKDEKMKNIMMSWYYAGYYTGLYEGQQQQVSKDTPPKQ